MDINRRKFLKLGAVAGTAAVCAVAKPAAARELPDIDPDWYGMLNDSTRCIGCKSCMVACKKENKLPAESTLGDAEDLRRPALRFAAGALRAHLHPDPARQGRKERDGELRQAPVHALRRPGLRLGLHRRRPEEADRTAPSPTTPGCAWAAATAWSPAPSASPSSSGTTRSPRSASAPCAATTRLKKGQPTACASTCPAGAITFGKRSELLKIARERIAAEPQRYLDHDLRRKRGRRHLRPLPDQEGRRLRRPRPAPLRLQAGLVPDREHPAPHLPVLHPADRRLRGAGRHHVLQPEPQEAGREQGGDDE